MPRVQVEEHPGVVVSCAVPVRMVWVVEHVLVVEVYPVPTLEEREQHLKWAVGVVLELVVLHVVAGRTTSVAEAPRRHRHRHRHRQLTDRRQRQLTVQIRVSAPVLE